MISWNVNGRRAEGVDRQADALLDRHPDVIALQEITASSLARWRERLTAGGLAVHADSSQRLSASAGDRDYRRRYFNLLASRWPLEPLPGLDVVFPERDLAARLHSPEPIELHVAHVPPGSTRGLIKVEMLEALYERLAVRAAVSRVPCGDFNTPRQEVPDGTVRFWGDRRGAHRDRWNAAERNVILGLAEHNLADAFRSLRGYREPAASWVWQRVDCAVSRRYDHTFASADLAPTACSYHGAWRDEGLSDHAAVEADFRNAER
jgi:exonuclease III